MILIYTIFIMVLDVILNLKKIILIHYLKILNISEKLDGGRTEIRTQERVAPLPVFKTGAFNHSAILP